MPRTDKNNLAENHFIIGDININKNDDTQKLNYYIDILSEYNLISVINGVNTRVRGDSASCIDHACKY